MNVNKRLGLMLKKVAESDIGGGNTSWIATTSLY